ncbi:MAG: extracellular solute-binding protein [Anaerolineae bacterium]|nr:extracellular solute-binding protein [Anaerolineae bacterium]
MKPRNVLLVLVIVALMVPAISISAQDDVELRILWYNDGNEGDVLRDLLDDFEAEYPNLSVEIDVVGYADLHNILQTQVEAGGNEAPDIARVTDTARFRDFYLDMTPYLADPGYWTANFAEPVLNSFRKGADDAGIYGFPTQFTVTGPYINRTLFEQAGVDVPSDVLDEPTWADWEAAAVEVADVTGVPYAIAIDRSGHRVWGPALSIGATFLNEDGSFTVDSPGFRATCEMIIGWHDQDITPLGVWIESGGEYASARPEFVAGQLVMYMSGSWQIAGFANDIGETFDWDVVPNPFGDGGSTGIPGGAVMAGLETTEHPEEVAMVMDYLASVDVLTEFTAKTLFIPGHIGIAGAGVEYVTDDPNVLQALNMFLAEVPKLADEAYGLQYSPIGFPLNVNIRDRLSQVIVGEMTLDEAIEKIQEAVDEAYAEVYGG